MTEQTERFGLPLLVQGQGQKDITHNEALLVLDSMIHLLIQDWKLLAPPESASPGMCWVVPEGAEGGWSGKQDMIAVWTTGGWRFVHPAEGVTGWLVPEMRRLRRDSSAWVVEAPIQTPEAAPTVPVGGTVVDVEARAALDGIVLALTRLGLLSV